jgi:membrane-bound serine protease (ClpP class)
MTSFMTAQYSEPARARAAALRGNAAMMPPMLRAALLSLAFWLATLLALPGVVADDEPAQPSSGDGTSPQRSVYLLEIRGAIGPSISDYIVRGLDKAQDAGAALVVLEMDTPGGLDTSMRGIIKAILASSVPVATFVHPSGSRAASAGAYILLASHVAAMAPATNVGAATPVPLGGGGQEEPAPKPSAEGGDKDGEDAQPGHGGAMERKAVNDAVAYIRSLAEMRGRNADWAEQAVREAASLSADAALADHVIDLIAADVSDLLNKLDGREIRIASGTVKLATSGLPLTRIEPDWRTRFLDAITNPSVAYLLLLVGIYGLIFEGYNPGAVLPGVVGAICLLLAAYALQLLSVNYAGFGLIVLGVLLMIMEVFMPSFGSLGVGGVIAFVIGSVILLDTDVPGFGIPRAIIGSIALVGGSLVFATAWFAVRLRRHPVVSGREHMLGSVAVAESDFAERGHVRVQGELWDARTTRPVRAGERLRIVAIDGLQLAVEPATEETT